jgi:hypothetical protein
MFFFFLQKKKRVTLQKGIELSRILTAEYQTIISIESEC